MNTDKELDLGPIEERANNTIPYNQQSIDLLKDIVYLLAEVKRLRKENKEMSDTLKRFPIWQRRR
jgi:hypothetical protein